MKKKQPWYLLSSHGLVLVAIARDPGLTVTELAATIGMSRATVLRAIRDLEDAEMVNVTRHGRRNTYSISRSKKFRHPMMSDRKIADLLGGFVGAGATMSGLATDIPL